MSHTINLHKAAATATTTAAIDNNVKTLNSGDTTREKRRKRVESSGMSLSCLTCQRSLSTRSDSELVVIDESLLSGRRCVNVSTVNVNVIQCCWSTKKAGQSSEDDEEIKTEEQEEEEESPMNANKVNGEGAMESAFIDVIGGQGGDGHEPRLMRCRAVRRDWNLDDLCKEVGVA